MTAGQGAAPLICPPSAGLPPRCLNAVVSGVQLPREFGGVGQSLRVVVKAVGMTAFQVGSPPRLDLAQRRPKGQVKDPVGVCKLGTVGQRTGRSVRFVGVNRVTPCVTPWVTTWIVLPR